MAESLNFSLVLSVVDKATAGLGRVAKAFDGVAKAGAALNKASAALRVGRENVDDFTGRMKAGLEAVLAPAAEVETALASIAADRGLERASASMAGMQAASLAWSSAHLQSSASYLATAGEMLKVTNDEAAAIKATDAALRVATGTRKDAGAVAATLGIIYTQVGDKTRDAGAEFGRLGDVLTRAQQVFRGIDIGALADPLKDALPAAKASKVSIEQTIAVLGHLNAAGVQGGEAGAGLAAVLEKMTDASKALGFAVAKTSDGGTDLIATLKNVETKYGSLQNMTPETARKIQEAFGPSAFKAISATLGKTGELGKAFGEVSNSAGAAARAQATMESTTAAQAQIAQQQIDALKVEIAAGLGPAIQSILPYAKDALGAISAFTKEHPQLVATAGSFAVLAVAAGTVAGPIMSGVGALTSIGGTLISAGASAVSFASTFLATAIPALVSGAASAWAFAAALLANPITWIVLGIIALAAVIYIYWEPISKFFSGIWNEIRSAFKESFVGGVLTVLKYISPIGWVVAAFGKLKPYLAKLWDDIKAAFAGGFLNGLKYLFLTFNPYVWMLKGWNALTQWLFGLSLKDTIWKVLTTANDALQAWNGYVMKFFGGLWGSIASAISGAFSIVVSGIKNDLAKLFTIFEEAGKNISTSISDGITSAASAPVEAMTAMVQKVRNLLPFSPAKDGPLRDLHKVKLVETVADAVRPAPLVDAMSGAAGDAMAALVRVPQPKFASSPTSPAIMASAEGLRGGAQPSGGGMNVTFQLGSSDRGPVAELEAWLANPSNRARLRSAIEADQQRENRTRFDQ